MPQVCLFKYSYPLTVMFNAIHTLGTMRDSSLGVWKNETLSGSLLDYVDFKLISFTTRNSTNQLYYSKGYRTTEIEGCFT
jgi:hypothetical protein